MDHKLYIIGSVNKGGFRMKKGLFVLFSLLIIVALSGCGSNNGKLGQENYISKEKTSYVMVDPQKEVDDKADWDVVDSVALNKVENSYKITYLKENHPEVVAVKKVSEAFLSAALNTDYRTYTGQEILPYFTQRRLAEDKQRNLVEQRKKAIVENEVVAKMTGVKNYTIYFNKNFTKCRVDVLPIVNVISAKEGYLGKGVVLNKDYPQITTLWLQKENDIWKVDALNFGGLKAN